MVRSSDLSWDGSELGLELDSKVDGIGQLRKREGPMLNGGSELGQRDDDLELERRKGGSSAKDKFLTVGKWLAT